MTCTRVKVCGITTVSDAVACHSLGVDYLGVIFAESVRRVTPERAREIRKAVPAAGLVGVFADEHADRVAGVSEFAGLDLIQLHGDESPAYCEALSARLSKPVVKAVFPNRMDSLAVLEKYGASGLFLFDLDKRSPNGIGAVRRLWTDTARATREGRRILLAGGLTPFNVREAIEQTNPYGVDVCRGVEWVPGVKDMGALRRFVSEVRR